MASPASKTLDEKKQNPAEQSVDDVDLGNLTPEKEEENDSTGDEQEDKGELSTPLPLKRTRERKTVDRFSSQTTPFSSGSKPLSVPKGQGTQLSDIPNVAYNISKRKVSDQYLQMLHSIFFNQRGKQNAVKKNLGLFCGFEESQRQKVKDKLDKCVKDKLVNFCDILNIPMKQSMKKEELSIKVLEFLVSPHVTTNNLLAQKEKKGKKQKGKTSARKTSTSSAKKGRKSSQVGEKRKKSTQVKEDEEEGSASEEESEGEKVISVEAENPPSDAESVETPKKKGPTTREASEESSESKSESDADSEASPPKKRRRTKSKVGPAAKKQETRKKSKATTSSSSAKKQGKAAKAKDEEVKVEPTHDEMLAVVTDMLKDADFEKATLSDILRQLVEHYKMDLAHRKAEVRDIITDVINSMDDEEEGSDEEEEDEDEDGEEEEAKDGGDEEEKDGEDEEKDDEMDDDNDDE